MIITNKQISHLMSMVQNYIFVCKQMDWLDLADDSRILLQQIREQQSDKLQDIKE